MAILFTIKHLLFGLLLAGCAGSPDEVSLMYGHEFSGNGSFTSLNGSDSSGSSNNSGSFRQDDSDMLGVSATWYVKGPREVKLVNAVVTPEVNWTIRPTWDGTEGDQDPKGDGEVPLPPAGDGHPDATSHVTQDVGDAVSAFGELGWLTQLIIGALVGLILWTYRRQIGNLIPGSKKNGGAKKK